MALLRKAFCVLLGLLSLSGCMAELVFTETPSDFIAVQGYSAVFHCAAYDSYQIGTVFVEWLHNNVPINSGGRFYVYPNGTLYLTTTQSGDEGNYTCTAKLVDSFGGLTAMQTPKSAWLFFAFLDEVFYDPTNMTVIDMQASPAYFQCISGDSLPLAAITWEKDGQPLADGQMGVIIYSALFGDRTSLKMSGTLQINQVRQSHAGRYQCVITNPLLPSNPKRSSIATLAVDPNPGAPYISRGPTDQIIPSGQPASFPCVILGDPDPTITWRMVGASSDIVNTTNVQVLGDGTLYFRSLISAHEASYVCTGTSVLGSISTSTVMLTVASMEWNFATEPTDLDILEGSPATLFCRPPASRPPANVTWYKGSLPYTPRTGATILDEGDLYFSSAAKPDAGQYFCVASNDFIPQQVTSRSATLTVAVASRITNAPNRTEVILGNELSLTCEAEGDPTPTITWYKDSRLLVADQRTTIGSSGLLHIRDIVAIDEGTYKCEAANAYNTDAASAFVNVLIPPQITSSPGEVTVDEGSQTTLPCSVLGDPAPTVTWYRDGAALALDLGADPALVQTNEGLVITEARTDHAGRYRCVVENSVGLAEATGTLIVWTVPSFEVRPQNQTVHQNMVVTFDCNATGTPEPTVSWQFNEGAVPSWASTSNGGTRLNIPKALPESTGMFTCVANNAQGTRMTQAYLDVLVEPFVEPLPNITLLAGQQMTIACQASGHPEPSFTWLRNQDALESRGRVTVTGAGVLTITGLTNADQDWYSCVASNSVGNMRESFYLSVTDIPGQPSILEAYPVSATSVYLVWVAGGDIEDTTHFQVQYKLSSSETWLTYVDNLVAMPGNQTYMLHSLLENKEYHLRAVAKNQIGQTPSAPSVVNTPSVTGPSPPRNFRVTVWNATSISLVWEIPSYRSGPIEIYMLEYHKANTSEYGVQHIPGTGQATVTATVTGLRPMTTYVLRVSATTLHNGVRQLGNHTESLEQMTNAAAPDASPINLTVTVMSSSSIQASWGPIPEGNRNGAITGYRLMYRIAGSLQDYSIKEVTAPLTAGLLTGLSPWTTYEVKVLGVNGEGDGPPSQAAEAKTTADAPTGVPQDIVLSTLNQTAISVVWQPVPMAGRNGPIDGYAVFFRKSGTTAFTDINVEAAQTALVIAGLDIASSYDIQILAFNLVSGIMMDGPKSALLTVATADDIPGPITGLTAVPGSTFIILSWSPPLVTNGLIQGYAVKYVAMQRSELAVTTTEATPTDTSPALTDSATATPTPTMEVTESHNRSRRQAVTPFSNATHGIVETTATSFTLQDLAPETRFWVGVIARTSAGFSPTAVSLYVTTGQRPRTPAPSTPRPPQTTPNTTVSSGFGSSAFFDLFNLPKTSLILFLSIIALGLVAIVLAVAVLSVWCGRRNNSHHMKRKATLLLPNDGRSSPGGSMPSDDVMTTQSRTSSHSVSRSHSPSNSSGMGTSTGLPSSPATITNSATTTAAATTALPPTMLDSQPLINYEGNDDHHPDAGGRHNLHYDHHYQQNHHHHHHQQDLHHQQHQQPQYHGDDNRPRASSSPASAQLSVRATAAPTKLPLPATASVNLYPTAPSPRNGRVVNAHSSDLLDTSPDGLEALYSRVNRTNPQTPSRLKKDSLAAIAVLLDQEENDSDLRPLDSPPSVVIANQRTTL